MKEERAKKIIIKITDCMKCRHLGCVGLGEYKCLISNKKLEVEGYSFDYKISIPDWCSLEDADD